jgi:DNA-binding FrmR family transcriptional regulator
MQHQSHPAILKRLKRTEGHLRAVIAMIEAHRPCLDLAQQLHAVERSISNAKRVLVQDHMEHCLGDSVSKSGKGAKHAMSEFKALAKYL